jgi:hypothetical protein
MINITIPAGCPTIYTMYSFPIITRQDRHASRIICGQDNAESSLEQLGSVKGLSYMMTHVPLNRPKHMELDNDNYYYMHGRTKDAFIVMVDKKSRKDLTLYRKGQLCRRFKLYAKKMYGIDPRQIYSLCFHNFYPINSYY